ncbi:MAG TPA: XRE family transcriptional regulator [Longimicrobium sp.]|jgi:Zn-dependent peptidase ImmA (M78 family)/transcriptional regulator with XRE-family HTH domain
MTQRSLFGGERETDALVQRFRPARLVLAREARGLQKRELADRVGLTPSAISQIERGKTRPTAETLLRLALTLGVRAEFLAAPPPALIAAEDCHFRRLRSATQTEQRRVRARGAMILEVVRHLEELAELPAESVTALAAHVEGRDEVEALAERVRAEWGLGQGPISSMVALLERHGVLPVEIDGHSERLDAFSVWADRRPMVFLATEKGSASRRRFDAAHELGHLLMHVDVAAGDAALENQADAFASAFLLPRASFAAECPARLSWPELVELKRRWKVSLAAMVRRAYDLGIYSEATYRRGYMQLNKRGWRESEPAEPEMERPAVLRQVIRLLEEAGYPRARVAESVHLHTTDLERLLLLPAA